MRLRTSPGQPHPLGASPRETGVNFSVFSRCSALQLLLFDRADDAQPARVIQLDPKRNRTFHYWHIFVEGLTPGQIYGFRTEGPYAPWDGLRFDPSKVLVDPYARAVVYGNYSRELACKYGVDNCAQAIKSVVGDPRGYDWEGDVPLQRRYAHSVIYEMHVGGFTNHPNSGVSPHKRGTYAGIIEKIPYLRDLGVTAVELLPVQQFDDQDLPQGKPLKNYWGYSPIAFFSPHRAYSSRTDPLGPVNEFRDMVKALHRAGIEVFLDVVFNHTAEGNHEGPTLSFRGLENRAYYILEQHPEWYANFSGCGNSLNANHSVVRRLIMDCLHYWVQVMHVDGFRFDLASVMTRDEWGHPLISPPTLWEIDSDPILAGTKVIAEAWDAAGLYQVGSFVGHRWAEWNGKYRDDVRRFIRGDTGVIGDFAARLTGSHDLYQQPDREPNRSINFITCHDGFTLNDLVSYNHKHNDDNSDGNSGGTNDNYSWNCGAEGPTRDPHVNALRLQQMKNLLTVLFISQGTPMLLMGDEVGRTQHGNNNAYCQNNEISWFNWENLKRPVSLEMLRFTRKLIRFSQSHTVFQEERFWSGDKGHEPYIEWHGIHLGQPDWSADSHSIAFSVHNNEQVEHFHVMINAYWEALRFEIPPPPAGRRWRYVIDTARPAPADFVDQAEPVRTKTYLVESRAVVILTAGV